MHSYTSKYEVIRGKGSRMLHRAPLAMLLIVFALLLGGCGEGESSLASSSRIRTSPTTAAISTIAGGGVADGGSALSANISAPNGIAGDREGNIYVADMGNHRIRKISRDGRITTIAGIGTPEFSGDGGPAIAAGLISPTAVAFDLTGNLYVAEQSRIRKIAVDGTITTIAGTDTSGYSGDGAMATIASLRWPSSIALDNAGNIYVADTGNHRIRRISPDGVIKTVAGNGVRAYSGDGGPATSASLADPQGVAVDGAGNLYVSDSSNHRVRQVTADGTIRTIAGFGSVPVPGQVVLASYGSHGYGYSGDGRPAQYAALYAPKGLFVDQEANLYIADLGNGRIRRITPDGTITTIAGTSSQGYSGDAGMATSAQLNYPSAIFVDTTGNRYIADSGNNVIRCITSGGAITTVAGNSWAGYSGDGGFAVAACLLQPQGVAVDDYGNLYVADSGNNRVRKIAFEGTISTVAGNGTAGFSGDGGAATAASLRGPSSVAIDGAGNIYVADSGNRRVRKIGSDGIITTIAGNGSGYGYLDGSAATAVDIVPRAIAADGRGNLYIAVWASIVKVTVDGTIHRIVGNGVASTNNNNVTLNAQLVDATALAFDRLGNLYVVDTASNMIRKITADGFISTVAGNGAYGYAGDGGLATTAELANPKSVTVDGDGNIYIADTNNSRIRVVTRDGVIHTVAGTGIPGFSGDGSRASLAKICWPTGLAVDRNGNVYFADSDRIRRLSWL